MNLVHLISDLALIMSVSHHHVVVTRQYYHAAVLLDSSVGELP